MGALEAFVVDESREEEDEKFTRHSEELNFLGNH
jgi:hypothetical protein